MPSAATTASGSDKAKTHKLALKGKCSPTHIYVHKTNGVSSGSSKLVTEFFEYGVNTILFQRGVYPPEDFSAYVEQAPLS